MYFADVFAICDYTLHICATPPLPTRRRRRLAAAQRGARLHVNAPQITACPAKKNRPSHGCSLLSFYQCRSRGTFCSTLHKHPACGDSLYIRRARECRAQPPAVHARAQSSTIALEAKPKPSEHSHNGDGGTVGCSCPSAENTQSPFSQL